MLTFNWIIITRISMEKDLRMFMLFVSLSLSLAQELQAQKVRQKPAASPTNPSAPTNVKISDETMIETFFYFFSLFI